MRDLGFDEVVGWSFTDPGEPGRLRIPADDPRANGVVLSNPLSEDQSVMRTTLLGSLLDIAQRNLSRGADAVALFESGRVYLQRRRRAAKPDAVARFEARRPPCRRVSGGAGGAVSASRTGSAALAVGPLAAKSWRGGGEPADFFALKGMLEGAGRPARRRALRSSRPRSRSCTPAARPGSMSAARPRAGSASSTRSSAGPGTSRPRSRFEVDLAALLGASPAGEETFEDVTTFPAVYQDLAVVVPDRGRGRAAARGRARRRRRAAARRRGLRPLRGRAAWRGQEEPRPAARVPRRRPHPHRRGGRRPAGGDRGRAGRRSEGRSVADARRTTASTAIPPPGSSSPAPPASPARSRRRSSGATRSWSWSRSPRAATPASGSTASTRATGCRWS